MGAKHRIRLSDGNKEDLGGASQLLQKYFGVLEDYEAESVKELLTKENGHLIVAEAEDKIIGMMVVTERENRGEVKYCVVSEESRGHGLSCEMFSLVIEQNWFDNYTIDCWGIKKDKIHLHKLISTFGFKQVGEPDDRWVTPRLCTVCVGRKECGGECWCTPFSWEKEE